MRTTGCAFVLALSAALAIHADYPRIRSLSAQDPLFVQIQGDIARYYRVSQGGGEETLQLSVFLYSPIAGEDLLSVAARFPLSQESLATINRIDEAADFADLPTVLVPSVPGVFVPDDPEGVLEEMLHAARQDRRESAIEVMLTLGDTVVRGRYFPGEGFSQKERAYFTRTYFAAPLGHAVLSSGFGFRPDPFTGNMEYHRGVDLVAPEGTEVMAARAGVVREAGYDRRYGNYVLIRHDDDFETLYAHLKWIAVGLNQNVNRGTILGGTGSTGLSTGTHLHFEIRRHGVPVDPVPLLPAGWNTP